MKRSYAMPWLAGLASLLACSLAGATLVQQMNLGELTLNADKVFRGTLVSTKPGTIRAGGGELATTTYVFRVTDTFKGDTSSANGKAGSVVEIRMIGGSKSSAAAGSLRHFNAFQPPQLRQGQEYLLFTTAPSSLGLSMTVGVGQGAFSFVNGENVINEAKNVGLFRDMDASGLPERGPIPYSALAERISSLVGNQ